MDWSKPPDAPPRMPRPQPKKVDKGFAIPYWTLSHRRRFWRTIYFLPLCLIFLFVPRVGQFPGWVFALFCLVLSGGQATYEYFKWQEDKRSGLYAEPPPRQF